MDHRSADEAAILEVLERQRRAARAGDFETLSSCFANVEYSTRWFASPAGGIVARQGWSEIALRLRASLAERRASPLPALDPSIVENIRVRIGGDMAWVTFTRRYPERPEHRSSPEPAHNTIVLERLDEAWKIVFFGFLEPGRGLPGTARIRLDVEGKVIWIDAAAEQALANDDDIAIRAGRLRLHDRGAQQRLAAALRWANGLDRGIGAFRSAIAVVLERGDGLATRVLWVVADNGAIILSLADPKQDARRLDAAAAVYGLSPVQRAVASQLVEGRSLPEIAGALAVRPTTVRTHLDRMFEKTGVRSQVALVRALLSAALPL